MQFETLKEEKLWIDLVIKSNVNSIENAIRADNIVEAFRERSKKGFPGADNDVNRDVPCLIPQALSEGG